MLPEKLSLQHPPPRSPENNVYTT